MKSNGRNKAQNEMQELHTPFLCVYISKKSLEIEFILEDCTKVIKYVESAASSALEIGVSLSVGLKETKPNYACLEHL